jgi:hypothetical protein
MMARALLHRAEGDPVLARQASVIRGLGSPFVADILEAGQRQIERAPRVARLIATWPGDADDAALAMRFNAALHAIARRSPGSPLGRLYAGVPLDKDAAVGAAVEAEEEFIATWMQHPPQTNEVGRAGAVMAALMVLREQAPLPVDLCELGASGGLNLNLARYRHELGGVIAGDPSSDVLIAPAWSGPPPPARAVEIGEARGVDLDPLDPSCDIARERLLAYVFVDQPMRRDRLGAALALARSHPPMVERGDATAWLARQLAVPPPAGRCRVVVHSMVMQYLNDAARRCVGDLMALAGSQATAERPLARIGFEWSPGRREVRLSLATWPGTGTPRVLATCHPYGASIAWRGTD